MILLGITGPTGAGKTTLLREVERRGGLALDLDALYHELLETDRELLSALRGRFPEAFAGEHLDRKLLGGIVHGDRAALRDLGNITVPYINRETDRRLQVAETAGKPLAAVDAINLLSGAFPKRCAATIAVTAPEDIRLRRLTARDGITEEYAKGRIASQPKNEYFISRCTYHIENSGTEAEFAEKCRALLSQIEIRYQKGSKPMDEKKKDPYQELRKNLLYKPKNGWTRLTAGEKPAMEDYAGRYIRFLNAAKTEREAVKEAIRQAEAAGFVPLTDDVALTPGTKVYAANRGKAINLAVIGKQPVENGLRITAAHIDNPRLDLKPNPLYEDDELAFLQTHYYGGIKKYQWPTIPLALHGVITRKDGVTVNVCVGEEEGDPVFFINDLLIHLADAQMRKSLAQGVTGENLNVIVGSVPLPDDPESGSVKLAVLKLLNEKYGITEEDFISGELCFVPASKARETGFDRSLIAAFGHDDRSCAFAALDALLAMDAVPEYTAVCCLADKEEIGSMGISGMQSQNFELFVEDLLRGASLRRCLRRSECLSADVTNGYDPTFPDACDKSNNAHLGYGVCFQKYTGSRGKYDSSEASSEFVAKIRRLCDDNGVIWQTGELGKVDAGGGGTVAQYMANRNIQTLDTGVPVLSMHAPLEMVSKLDCYETRQAMLAFYQDATAST